MLLSVLWDLGRARRGGPAAVAARQHDRLASLTAYARTRSRFYAELYRDLPARVSDVGLLPVTDQAAMMARFDDTLTDPAVTWAGVRDFLAEPGRIGTLFRDRYQVVTTSGTSGTRGVFVQDERMYEVLTAITAARASGAWLSTSDYPRLLRRGGRVAAIWATGGHYAGYSTARRLIRERPPRDRSIKLFSVHTPLEALVDEIDTVKPALLNGYASVVAQLAREQRAGRLDIRPILVITSAEGLAPAERARIRDTWKAKVRDQYACSEFMGLAHGCREDWLHVNADWAILEPVDAQHRPVPPGEPSHTVLLTNLANRVQPIIRYDLGDSVTQRPDPCPCGNPLPAIRVTGRTSDLVTLRRPDGREVALPPLTLSTLIDRIAGVRSFQIVLTDPRRLAVRLVLADDQAWPQIHIALRGLLDQRGLPDVPVERDPKPPQRSPGGKFRTIVTGR